MMVNLPPYFQETRDQLVQTVIDTYGQNATYPTLPVPPPPAGEPLRRQRRLRGQRHLRAVVRAAVERDGVRDAADVGERRRG
jgi:hypothetical protein